MKIKSLVIMAVLVMAIFGFAFNTQAQTDVSALIAQLQAQIASLTAQLQALLAQQQGGQTWCHTFNANFGVGGTGDEVKAFDTIMVQTAMESMAQPAPGYVYKFDELKVLQVIAFQKKYGIPQTGFVGPLTRAKLNSLYGCKNNQCVTDNDCPQPNCGGATNCIGSSYKCDGRKCVLDLPTCTPNWTCGWGPCVNGYQSQRPVDSNNCPPSPLASMPYIPCPTLARACLAPQSAVTIISPKGGETWQIGQTYVVSYTLPATSDYASVFLDRYDPTSSKPGPNSSLRIATSGVGYQSVTYTVADIVAIWPGLGSTYKVKVCRNEDYDNCASSNYLSIVAATPQPVVGIASPNMGENWQIGGTYTIRWFADKFNTSDKVNIALIDARGGDYYYTIARNVSAYNNSNLGAGTPMGSYSWTVPSTGITPGNGNPFKIYVGKYSPPSQSGDWIPLKPVAETGVYGYGNNFNIGSANALPIINEISTGGAHGTSASVVQGQSTVIGLYGSNFTGAIGNTCGVNSSALDGITVTGNCNVTSLNIGFVIQVSPNATPGDRQLTVTTPNGISNSVTLTVLSSSVARSIQVTSPNGGEIWKIGETHRVTWASQGIDTVSIYVYNDSIYGSGSTNYLDSASASLSVPASQGYFDWTIAGNLLPGYGLGGSADTSKYKIRIDGPNPDVTGVRDSSDNYFSIVAP